MEVEDRRTVVHPASYVLEPGAVALPATFFATTGSRSGSARGGIAAGWGHLLISSALGGRGGFGKSAAG